MSIRPGHLIALGGLWGLSSVLVAVVMLGLEPSTGRSSLPPVGEAAEVSLPEATFSSLERDIKSLNARIELLDPSLGREFEEAHEPPVAIFSDAEPLAIDAETTTLYGQEYLADGVIFCCDRSIGVDDKKNWQKVQREVIKNLSRYSEGVQFAIIAFGEKIDRFPRAGGLARASAARKAAAMAFVMNIDPLPGSCGKPALLEALEIAGRSTARRTVIFHLSTGINDCPGASVAAYPDECLAAVEASNRRRVPIHTICIGPTGDVLWMERLAARNNGQAIRAR